MARQAISQESPAQAMLLQNGEGKSSLAADRMLNGDPAREPSGRMSCARMSRVTNPESKFPSFTQRRRSRPALSKAMESRLSRDRSCTTVVSGPAGRLAELKNRTRIEEE